MKDLFITGDNIRPTVQFTKAGKLSIEGRSVLEYADLVFDPMYSWLEEYIENPAENTVINVCLEYFNSSTSKALVHFLILSKKLKEQERNFEINYYYDDESILDYGKDFSEVVGIPFNFIEKKFH